MRSPYLDWNHQNPYCMAVPIKVRAWQPNHGPASRQTFNRHNMHFPVARRQTSTHDMPVVERNSSGQRAHSSLGLIMKNTSCHTQLGDTRVPGRWVGLECPVCGLCIGAQWTLWSTVTLALGPHFHAAVNNNINNVAGLRRICFSNFSHNAT